MRKTLVALASMPVLSLITAIALADVSGIPNPSGNGIVPTEGEIKNRNQCDGAAFFKNVFPSLTNGGPGGSDFVDLTVDGETVRVEVTWYAENYFSFATNGAYLKKVGVTVDRNNFIFDYTGNELDGIADTQLNYYTDSITGVVLSADDVNHLDLCVVTVDGDAPDVGEIRVEPSSDGTTVSGEITISTDITDESDQSVLIEIFQIVNGEDTTSGVFIFQKRKSS